MRRIFRALPIVCTLLLLGLGAFLPRLAALAVDRRLAREVVQREHTNLSLALEREADFFQTLALFRGGDSQIQVKLSEGYYMEAEEAKAAAVEARGLLTASETAYAVVEVTPMLLTSRENPDVSGVFWQCVMRASSGAQEMVWLDDQSGLMVSFAGRVEWSSLSAPNTVFPQSVVAMAEYCRQSYPADTVKLSPADDNNLDGRYIVTLIQSQDGQENSYSIPLRIADGWLYYNT